MIHICVFDELRLAAEGIQKICSEEADMEVTHVVQRKEDALKILKSEKIDVILIDVHMNHCDPIEFAIQAKEIQPDIKTILLTEYIEEELVIPGMLAKIDGGIPHSIDGKRLREIVRLVYDGYTVRSQRVAHILNDFITKVVGQKEAILGLELDKHGIDLTKNELRIAFFLHQDYTNKELANILDLAEGTVKTYISDLYTKLNVTNRAEAIAFLKRLGVHTYGNYVQ